VTSPTRDGTSLHRGDKQDPAAHQPHQRRHRHPDPGWVTPNAEPIGSTGPLNAANPDPPSRVSMSRTSGPGAPVAMATFLPGRARRHARITAGSVVASLKRSVGFLAVWLAGEDGPFGRGVAERCGEHVGGGQAEVRRWTSRRRCSGRRAVTLSELGPRTRRCLRRCDVAL
jgi:hypothetical protein